MQLAVSSTKMKSLFKGLRYISQVFAIEGEKEPEMQIGNPTDVKHVAHIGWDGPSENATAPSWMNDFKCQSEYSGRSRDLPKLPKSSRKSAFEKGSPTKQKTDKTNRPTSHKGTSSSQHSVGLSPEIPKKSKRKKAKEGNANGGSPRSSSRSEVEKMSDFTSDTGSVRSMSQFDDDRNGF
ncbi:unnamed protein product [Thlaspi arvense]|uniref:CRIB domain-containing protein n=1 Tax=Thlaspi arvense TaxID=13288 RepID=A0AAU9T2U5_THLAR|nr:unnamed protein product [Thlaspi arvense]